MGAGFARAFGLDLQLGFDAHGLPVAERARADHPVVVELVDRAAIEGAWRGADCECLMERLYPDGSRALAIDHSTARGYRLFYHGHADFWVSSDGDVLQCAPGDVEDWVWQRFLIGQALPFVAVLRGLEVFHAGAVAVGSGAVALAGAPEAGKSSLTTALTLQGARFMTDDVVAAEAAADGVIVHPGAGLVSLRHDAATRLPDASAGALGRVLGDDGEALRIEVPRADAPERLRTLYFLEPTHGPTRIEPLRPLDPKLLLGGSFNFVLRGAYRLARQLDMCARIERSVEVLRISIGPDQGPPELAARLLARHQG